MCFYDPPLFLGTPDVSAAMICAFPLAMSAVGWRELVSSTIGLAVAFLAAHFAIVAMQYSDPITVFYWIDWQAKAVPPIIVGIALMMVLVYAVSSTVRGRWRVWHLLLALALLGGVVGAFLVADAWALPASGVERPPVTEDIIIADCLIPPFGEGLTGYTMLAVLVIFEVLVAVGIADMLKRLFVR